MLRTRFAYLLLSSALICGPALSAPPAPAAAVNGPPGGMLKAMAAPAGSASSNHGHFVCTAAIHSNGSVYSGEYVNGGQTMHLATGQYQVAFNAPCPDVRIALGWFRVVQPDTLTIGTLPAVTCITADRYGVASAVWVECYGQNGQPMDASFTLSVSR
ncbi:MAG: hypothetical protein JSR60_10625 [Proteobacteria bacterium]|nr:hypothetical protein [Pseudomonadota bacterium]